MKNKDLRQFILGPFIVVILHIIAVFAGWYEMFWWFDIPMHLVGGLAITFSAAVAIQEFKNRGKLSITWKPLNILLLLGLASLAAFAWEIMEFALDIFFHTDHQPSVLDTMKDICMGLIGGAIVAIVTTFKKLNKKI